MAEPEADGTDGAAYSLASARSTIRWTALLVLGRIRNGTFVTAPFRELIKRATLAHVQHRVRRSG